MKRFLASFTTLDWTLIGPALALVSFGLVMLYGLTLHAEAPDYRAFIEQAAFAGIGLVLMIVVGFFDYRTLRAIGWQLYAGGALLLIAVLLFGTEIRNTKSWFDLGIVSFQPIELVKLCLIVFFAKYFTEHVGDVLSLRHLVVGGGAVSLYVILALFQPDLGSSIILLAVFFSLALLVNVRRGHIVLLVALFVGAAVASWFFAFKPYQRERILTLLNPSRDPLGYGYNIQQSMVAVGSGGLFGRGLGLGPQSQLNFLPEQRNDFLFAVVAEELGFLGAGLLLALFLFLLVRLFLLARRTDDDFGAYLVFGITVMLLTHILMNVGMNLGLLPVAGVPLPFVSSGGSSLVTTFLAIGMAVSVSRTFRQRRFTREES